MGGYRWSVLRGSLMPRVMCWWGSMQLHAVMHKCCHVSVCGVTEVYATFLPLFALRKGLYKEGASKKVFICMLTTISAFLWGKSLTYVFLAKLLIIWVSDSWVSGLEFCCTGGCCGIPTKCTSSFPAQLHWAASSEAVSSVWLLQPQLSGLQLHLALLLWSLTSPCSSSCNFSTLLVLMTPFLSTAVFIV